MTARATRKVLKVDFGSGYNCRKGYKSCDITGSPVLDYMYDGNEHIFGLEEKSVDVFNIRNVVHHIPDLRKTFKCIRRYMKENGKIIITDCDKDHYMQNVCLDNLWYRYVIPRPEVYISKEYRNYFEILSEIGFEIVSRKKSEEKDITVWKLNNYKNGKYQEFSGKHGL